MPRVAERVLGGQPAEVSARGRLAGPQGEGQGLAEQPLCGIEGAAVRAAGARRPTRLAVWAPCAGLGSGHDDLAFFMPS